MIKALSYKYGAKKNERKKVSHHLAEKNKVINIAVTKKKVGGGYR